MLDYKTQVMKPIIFYITSILAMLLLCSEISFTWLLLAVVDIMLIAWCHKHLSLREFIRYTGYEAFYKYL